MPGSPVDSRDPRLKLGSSLQSGMTMDDEQEEERHGFESKTRLLSVYALSIWKANDDQYEIWRKLGANEWEQESSAPSLGDALRDLADLVDDEE